MIQRNSTFLLPPTEEIRISFVFLFFAAALLAQTITPTTKSKLNRG